VSDGLGSDQLAVHLFADVMNQWFSSKLHDRDASSSKKLYEQSSWSSQVGVRGPERDELPAYPGRYARNLEEPPQRPHPTNALCLDECQQDCALSWSANNA
jgi:hypothetical protein